MKVEPNQRVALASKVTKKQKSFAQTKKKVSRDLSMDELHHEIVMLSKEQTYSDTELEELVVSKIVEHQFPELGKQSPAAFVKAKMLVKTSIHTVPEFRNLLNSVLNKSF